MPSKEYPYKYETHCHTKEASACSDSSAAEMVAAYYQAGYSGLIITDHFINGNSVINPALSWPEKVRLFCLGYENAKAAAKELDFDVLFGWEYGYHGADFLTYGLTKTFLLRNPDMIEWPIKTYFERVHQAGGFIIHAHPFRERSYIKEIQLFPHDVDAVEVVNSGNDLEIFNQRAYDYANLHHLIRTRGSDSHHTYQLSGEGIYFPVRVRSNEELLRLLRQRAFC